MIMIIIIITIKQIFVAIARAYRLRKVIIMKIIFSRYRLSRVINLARLILLRLLKRKSLREISRSLIKIFRLCEIIRII